MKHIAVIRFSRILVAGALLGALTSCGDDGSIFSDESALSCVFTEDTPSGVEITNTCNSTIIVRANNNERLVIPPGETHKLTTIGKAFSLAACFSPAEPDFEGDSFICR